MRKDSIPISRRRVMAPGASLVCRVERTRCPVKADSMAMSAVSLSRISPMSRTSGVLAHQGTERVGECEIDLGLHLDLIDPVDLVLDRVFHGDDLARDGIEFPQNAVEGGGFARNRSVRSPGLSRRGAR